MTDPVKVVVIVGPTASGKTELAVRLAEELDGEVVNADSVQVYRGMDIGSAKAPAAVRQRVRHHLLDVADPGEPFSAARFVDLADEAIADIAARGKRIFVVGGTGLYIRALLQGLADSPTGAGEVREELEAAARRLGGEEMLRLLAEVDPETAARLHPNDLFRIIRALEVFRITGRPISSFRDEHRFAAERYRALQVGLHVPREELNARIDARVERMMAEGLVEEVRALLEGGVSRDLPAMKSLGYRQIAAYLEGEVDLAEAVRLIQRDTRRYAKRQMTWFHKETSICWFEYPGNFATIFSRVMEFLA